MPKPLPSLIAVADDNCFLHKNVLENQMEIPIVISLSNGYLILINKFKFNNPRLF